MAERGGQPGNKNGSKGKPWEEAIRRALLADSGVKLRALAEKLISRAEEGDMTALKEIGDRLDGKPAQAITGADGGPIEVAAIDKMEIARRYAFLMSRAAIEKAAKASKEPA